MAPHVLRAMEPYFSDNFFNPSSPYAPAVAVRREYESAKQQLAESFGAKGDELVITAGATESINLALGGVRGVILASTIEHPAVLEVAKTKAHTLVNPDDKGRISPERIAAALTPEVELVSIALANNELGTVQPIRRIAAVIEAERRRRLDAGEKTRLVFHCDASQGFDQLDVHVARLGVDLLTLNAGKMYGPKQVALLWAKRSVQLTPTIVGGGQERGLRSGTENVSGVIGFAEAATWTASHRHAEAERLRRLRDRLEASLQIAFPESRVLGAKKHRLAGHLSMAFPGVDAERIIFMLEARGVYLSTGSACSANKHTASHVLVSIGLEDELINGSLRMTLGHLSDEENTVRAAEEIIAALRQEYDRMAA